MPKAKKRGRGRPPLPKGHVKAIVPLRFKDEDVKQFSKAAKARKQTLSEWIRDGLKVWDDRLDENGIDAIVWQGADQGNPHLKTLWIIFKELISDARKGVHRFEIVQELAANEDENHYSTTLIDQQLQERGIENVWVTTTKRPIRSAIHIKFADLPEPITIIKRY